MGPGAVPQASMNSAFGAIRPTRDRFGETPRKHARCVRYPDGVADEFRYRRISLKNLSVSRTG